VDVLSSRILLRPGDLDRSRRFYRDLLGLAVYREFGPPDDPGLVFFLGQGPLEVSGRAAGPPGRSVMIWIQVRDVHAEHARLAAAGVPVMRELAAEPWGLTEMHIEDPDGVRIILAEVPAGHPLRRDPRPALPPGPRTARRITMRCSTERAGPACARYNMQIRAMGGLSGSCVVVVLVLAGTDRVRLRLAGLVRGGYGAARWRGSAESTWKGIAGRQQVHGRAAAAGSLSKPGMRGSPARWCSRGRPPAGEPGAGGAPACGSGDLDGAVHACTRDRRRGWPGARTYGGQRRRSGHLLMVFTQVTGHVEVEAGAGCKTVGSAYVGSNPTPATTSENGPLAAETRPGGPFLYCHAMYQGCVTASRCIAAVTDK